ncbi:hypothetical protein D3C72_1710770 [compost metagenome]
MFARQFHQVLDRLQPRGRDAHQRDAAITFMGQAFDLAARFHAVEQPRHRRLLGHRHLRELADADRVAAGQRRHHAPLRHRKTLLPRHLVELRRDQLAGLREQRGQVVIDEAMRFLGWFRHEGASCLPQACGLHG